MDNFVQEGKIVAVTANRTALAGAGMKVGQIFGVLVNDAVDTTLCQLRVEGAVQIAKTSALALTQGDTLYWDPTNFVVNKTATAQKEVGVALESVADPSPAVKMKLALNVHTSVAAIASLTDNSGGTASDTLADVPATYTEATLANQVASLAAKINTILTALRTHGLIAP